MKEIHLHIDRITVEGLSAGEQRRFARALETELHALAAEAGVGAIAAGDDRRIRSVNAGVVLPGVSANRAAAQVAKSIRRSLAGQAGPAVKASGEERRRDG